ncbi:MAG: response regulator [Salibacteraceae bacterium]
MTTSLLIVDDRRLVNEGLAALIGQYPRYQVEGQALSGKEALRFLNQKKVDVVILDHQMPGQNGLKVLAEIQSRFSSIKVIVVTYLLEELVLRDYVKAGVEGLVLKHDSSAELVLALDQVSNGGRFFSSGVTQMLSGAPVILGTSAPSNVLNVLTPSEREILSFIGKGHTVQEIATLRQTAVQTVKRQKQNIMDKLDIHKEIKLMRLAIEEGLA